METIKHLYTGHAGLETQTEEEHDFSKSRGHWNMDVGAVYPAQSDQCCSIVGGQRACVCGI